MAFKKLKKHRYQESQPSLLILNQMAGPMTWELAEDLGKALGNVALFTGHPDTLQKSNPNVQLFSAVPYNRGSFARRALSWLHYCWQAFWWLWRWPKEVPMLLFSNPPMLVWLGYLMNHLRGQKYAVMVHDIYPDVLVRTNVLSERHLAIRIWRWCNRHAYERASIVMTLGEYMAETLSRQFDPAKTLAGQIEVIPPWVDTDIIKPIPKEENWFAQQYNQVDKLTVMYSGNMGIGHDIETMIEAARLLRERNDIHFMFIGAGPKWVLVDEVMQRDKLPNVTLLGWQPEETIPYSLATADVAFVSLESTFEGIMVPSKAGYSLAVGSGLLLLASGENELNEWIERHCLGTTLEPGNANGVAQKLSWWADEVKSLTEITGNSRHTASNQFDRKNCTSHINNNLASILTSVNGGYVC